MKKIIGILMLSLAFLSVAGAIFLMVGWAGTLIIFGSSAAMFILIVFGMKFLCEG